MICGLFFGDGWSGNRLDAFAELGFFFELGSAEVVVGLQVDPELGFHVEEDAEGESGLGGDGAPAFDDLGDARGGNAGAAGELSVRNAHRVQKLFEEDSTGGGSEPGFLFGGHCSVLFLTTDAHG